MHNLYIFDFDGTLIDSSEGIICSLKETLNFYGLPVLTDKEAISFIGPPIFESLKNKYNISDKESMLMTNYFRDTYESKYLFNAKIYEGVIETLAELKTRNSTIAIASYKKEDHVKKITNHFKINNYFDLIKGSNHTANIKKEKMLAEIINFFNAKASNTIMIGDTMSDFFAAKKNSVEFIAAIYGFGQFSSDALANSILNIKEIKNYEKTY